MKKIKLLIELKYDAKLMHGSDKEAIDWFYKDILGKKSGSELYLHSNEIGDTIGTVKLIKVVTK